MAGRGWKEPVKKREICGFGAQLTTDKMTENNENDFRMISTNKYRKAYFFRLNPVVYFESDDFFCFSHNFAISLWSYQNVWLPSSPVSVTHTTDKHIWSLWLCRIKIHSSGTRNPLRCSVVTNCQSTCWISKLCFITQRHLLMWLIVFPSLVRPHMYPW